MKFKNRKGSTLALTLIVFAVLMILGTFILGFMVTENKQAMYHQNKTQAYYIARSGAEVVEAGIKGIVKEYTGLEVTNFINQIPTNDPDNPLSKENYMVVSTSDLDFGTNQKPKTYLYKEFKNENMYGIIVVSEAEVGGVIEILEKEILAPISIESGVTSDSPLNYITGSDPIEKTWTEAGHKIKKAKLEDYPYFNFDKEVDNFNKIESLEFNEYNEISNKVSLSSGNYKFSQDLNWTNKEVIVDGEVNIYVHDFVNIHNLKINGKNKSVLNVFIYGNNVTNGNSLFTLEKSANHIDGNVEVNFYMEKGNAYINLFQNKNEVLDANIVCTKDVETIELTAHSNSGKPNIIGLIYAPGSDVIFGEVEDGNQGNNKASLALKGLVIANNIKYNPHNKNYNQLDKKLIITSEGIEQDETSLNKIVLTLVGDGYYR